MREMKKKIIVTILLLLMVCFLPPNVKASETTTPLIDEKSFLQEFSKALEAKDQARMEELVKWAVPHVVYEAVISQATKGISSVAEGKDGSISFNAAEVMATAYAKVFKKEGLVELVRKYKVHTQEMCRKKLRGDDLIEKGNSLYQKGQLREAVNNWIEAQKIYEGLGDVEGRMNALTNIGRFYYRLGQYTEALHYHEQALEIARKIGDVAGEAYALGNIGRFYYSLGQYTEALRYYQQALEIARKIGDVAVEAAILTNIGVVYKSLGQYSEDLRYHQQALEIARKIGAMEVEEKALTNIGLVYGSLGQYTEALRYHQQALEIARKIGDVAGEAGSLNNIGVVYGSLGQYAKALEYYRGSLEIAHKIGDVAGEARSFTNIGVVYYSLRQYSEAIKPIQESIKIGQEIGNLETVWRGHLLLGMTLWRSGKEWEAISSYEKGVATIEKLYSYTTGFKEEERSSMIGEKSYVYKEFIELLLELHRKQPTKGYDREAFRISEKSKSRTFQELMAKAGAKIALSGDETFKKMIGKEQQLIGKLTNLRSLFTKEMSKPEKERNQEVIDSLKSQISKTDKSLIDLEKESEAQYPRYADLKRPKSLTVEELQATLKSDETVISYAVGKDKIAAFVITKKSFKFIEINTSQEELSKLIRRFRRGLEDVREIKDLEKFKPEVAYELYQKIFHPLSSVLKGVTKLYISSDGILYTLPFEALVDKEINEKAFDEARERGGIYLLEYSSLHYLIDTYTITYLPSVSVLYSLRKYEKPGYGKWSKPLIAFADPIFSEEEKDKVQEKVEVKGKEVKQKGISQETELTVQILTRSTGNEKLERLKESAQEAEAISKELKSKKEDIYLREKASEDNVYRIYLKNTRYILFSTHGLLGGDFSGVAEPALALTLIDNPPGRDGFLTMSEVLGLDLNSELIILSACNTSGKGDKAGSGEGFVGLTRSFMYAGGKSLLVTHWSVESEAARDLMVNTMRLMRVKTKPEALREAKLKMKKSIRQRGNEKISLSHPFFWAPFVLVGEGK
jgi:CHAT domain-containing protein/Tfp pilus assembly protein PilF